MRVNIALLFVTWYDIITSRAFAGKDNEEGKRMRCYVENSLSRNGIVYDKIVYTSELKSKTAAILELGVQVMIDDSVWNLEELSNHVPVICYHQIYNRNFAKENVVRAKNWKEIYKIIENMSKIQKKRENFENK